MALKELITDSLTKRTQQAFLWVRLLGTPCWCLLTMLVFILYKHASLTALQITVTIALKPASSLLSPYWSSAIYRRPDRLAANLIAANLLRHLPFLFIPWVDSAWFIIAAFGLYTMLSRATIPAWMEMLKHNLPKPKREEMVSYGSTIDYLGTALLAVAAGFFLDHYAHLWRWLFTATALLGLLSTLFLLRTSPGQTPLPLPSLPENLKISERIFKPWKQVWQLVRTQKEFAIFQIGFMLGGAGLMIMQPALPQLFIDTLHLSFVEMGLAIALCKGVGVALTSGLWTRLFRKLNLFQLSALVTFFATLFPFFLLASSLHLTLLYIAYGFYGIMQAGSELSWHMSGLVFAKEKDSSTFSITNVLTVGLRGSIIPALGTALLPFMQPLGVILLGALLCLFASLHFLFYSRSIKSLALEKGSN